MEKETRHYAFFQNRACEYFPCHETDDPEHFNCLFCYCPLYALGELCGLPDCRAFVRRFIAFERERRPA